MTEPVYILAITNDGTQAEMDAMYRAGVDQLLPRMVPKKLLYERMLIAFKALSLRRISRVTCSSDIVTVDLASGAHTARHLVGRLAAEIDLACQTSSTLEVAMVRIGSVHSDITVSEDLVAVLEAVQTSLRPHIDWVAWLHMVGHSHRLAVVMPNPGHLGATALEQHVRNAFAFETSRELPDLAFGHASFHSQSNTTDMTALVLLAQAEQGLRSVDLSRASTVAAVTA